MTIEKAAALLQKYIERRVSPAEHGMTEAIRIVLAALDERTKRLEAALEAAQEALSSLYDHQNGPPLLSPRHKAAWEAAMEQARSVLASPGSALLERLERLERLEAVVEAARIICRSWDFDSLKAALAQLDGAEGGATS